MARGYVINQNDAVRALLEATQFSPLRPRIITWLQNRHGAANQTFNALTTHLSEIESINQNLATLAVGPLFAPFQANGPTIALSEINAVSVSTVVSNADILRTIQSLTLFNNTKIGSESNSRKNKSGRSAAQTYQYCWTHGNCGHTSAVCNRSAQGHIKTATAASPAGGNTSNYVRPISK